MNFLDLDQDVDLRPGLVLGLPEPPVSMDLEVATDVTCFLRVRCSPTELVYDPEDESEHAVERRPIKTLPGSPAGEDCLYRIVHHALTEWEEAPFVGEFRSLRSAATRMYFDNGGRKLHLVTLDFWVPPLDIGTLREDEDPEDVIEERLDAALLSFYSWGFERLDDFEGGEINQLALPELWTSHGHLVPEIWKTAAGFCRVTGNRFVVADCAPPLSVLREAEIKRCRQLGYELEEDELAVSALVPWFEEERWQDREDIPVEVALTLEALRLMRLGLLGGLDYPQSYSADRPDLVAPPQSPGVEKGPETDPVRPSREAREILSCIGVYWPWLTNLRRMALPPCAAVCGVYARSDSENGPVGVMKPPANERVRGVRDLALHIDERPENLLQRDAINLLTARVGKGIVVWGARTQCSDDIWRFVNVRRLIGYIGKQIQVDNQWAVFENNTEELRAKVARDVGYFLHDLWEKGALLGQSPEQAFQVVCSEENNPKTEVERGILVVDVWVNPIQTNEFVHLQLTYGDALVE